MNKHNDFEIPYPRYAFRRKIMNFVGRLLLRLLTRPKISGLENIPTEGPVILAGNHLSSLEPVLMAVYPKRLVEPLGAGDMPFEGMIDKVVSSYGFIPVNRGTLDRKAMNRALGVLEQDGILGIFPEGGTWNPGHMRAQVGVSWLSHRAGAPVIPIGFSGMLNAFSKVFKLQRPIVQMKVGKLIPALNIEGDSRALKTVYQEHADMVLEKIMALVDPQDFLLVPEENEFSLQILTEESSGETTIVELAGAEALSEFLFTPIILETLSVNLKKAIEPLYPKEQPRWNQQFSSAIQSALEVLETNPGFFTYRMGMEQGHQTESALRELAKLLAAAYASQKTVVITASVRSRFLDGRLEEKTFEYRILPEPI